MVADELRTLASRTQQSTEEIKQIIDRLQAGATKAVDAIAKGASDVKISEGTIIQASEALKGIDSAVSNITELNLSVAHALKEQLEYKAEIDDKVALLNEAAKSSQKTCGQLASESVSLKRVSQEMGQQLAQLRA